MEVRYVFQELTDLPAGYTVPAVRKKPWGTNHAVLAARHVIDGPFAVINADDYYGPGAFGMIYDYLTAHPDQPDRFQYAMAGYLLGNTVTDNGSVAWERFPYFLDRILAENPEKGEFFIPLMTDDLIRRDRARIRVLSSTDKWFGVTYREDKPSVVAALREKTEQGLYPENLWNV